MRISNIPVKFSILWGANAGTSYINSIPAASQVGSHPGYASLNDGFVPLNATPVSAGGVPPRIQDWNGILNEITGWNQWQQAGGPVAYDAAFQSAIGGYPKGALISSTSNNGAYWLSTTDANTSNPESSGANWVPVLMGISDYAVDTGTANSLVVSYATGSFTVPSGTVVGVRAKTANTGNSAIQINGISFTITQGGVTLSGGEIVANWPYLFLIDSGYARMIGSGSGSLNVGTATASTHAIQLGQASTQFNPGRLINIQTFSTGGSYTYTPTAGTNTREVEILGGGGAGGGTAATSSGGQNASAAGGAGGARMILVQFGVSNAPVTGTIGAGGTPGAAGNNAGGGGGATTFGPYTAPGGSGGNGSPGAASTFVQGATCGTPTGGLINIAGKQGGAGLSSDNNTPGVSGFGGDSPYGSGGVAVGLSDVAGSVGGVSGTGNGAGGSGSYAGYSGAAQAGGAGTQGLVIIREYS